MDTSPATRTNRSVDEAVLYMAIELSLSKWVLAFSGPGARMRRVSVAGADRGAVLEAVAEAKRLFGLPAGAPVRSCHEAGLDGFWVHRWLTSEGIENLVVDSSSIEVNRRARRAKTDRLDAQKLVEQLARWHGGEKRVWSVVRVPSPEAEDGRRLHREWERLKKERTAHVNRIHGLLATVGIRLEIGSDLPEMLDDARLWDGSQVPCGLKSEIVREHGRLRVVEKQLGFIQDARDGRIRRPANASDEKAARLMTLKGIGPTSAWLLSKEFFGWRTFHNRRQVGAAAGMTGTPYDSGGSAREQGISKAGNRRVRALVLELAWRWLYWQPQSALSQWFHRRFGEGGKRSRRVGIVAVARRLLVALWRFVEQEAVPEGAILARKHGFRA